MKFILALFVFVATPVAADEPVSHMDRSLFLRSTETRPKGPSASFGSGFVIDDGGRLILCTNGHVAEETSGETTLTLRTPDGRAHSAPLKSLIPVGVSPWVTSPDQDLAAAVIEGDDAETIGLLRAIATPLDHVAEEPPPRAALIHVVGFPGGKSVDDGASATVISARVASRVVTSRGVWGKIATVYATPPVSTGGSGSPAYDPATTPPAIVGVVYAISADETGANYTKLVPPGDLIKLIERTREGSDADE